MVTGGISDNFSDVEQQERKQLWMDYQYRLLPETEIVYSEISLYCCRMKVSTIN
jgi:hypothetical protein